MSEPKKESVVTAADHITTKNYAFTQFVEQENRPGEEGIIGAQIMSLYRAAAVKDRPVVLELGTQKGVSTTAFLQACHEKDGQLVSVDILDFSDVSSSDRWTFVRSDSTDVAYIVGQAPVLERGVDVIYIDSLHKWTHVRKEIYGWYPHLNPGCVVFFDDVDANPYRAGNRKDNFLSERNWDEIHDFVQAFFYANKEDTRLSIAYGSTGLARLDKLGAKGTEARPFRWADVARRKDVANLRRMLGRLTRKLS